MTQTALTPVVRHLYRVAGVDRTKDQTDAQLLHSFVARREESAFAALLGRHGRLVMGVCRRVLAREQDAEDAFQATFLTLVRRADSIRSTEAVGSWLYRVAYRIARRARASAVRRAIFEQQAAVASQPTPACAASLRELQRVLDEELNQLPEKLRAPFVLCCLDGRSRSEAARELVWKEGTVAGRLAQARDRLQRRLTRRGITLSAVLCAIAVAPQAVAASLLRTTQAAALCLVEGAPLAAGGASVAVAALVDGSVTATTRAKLATAVILAAGVVASAVGLQPPASEPSPASPVAKGAPNQVAPTPDDTGNRPTIRGQVLAPDGKPVAGATIYRLDFGDHTRKAAEMKVATTGPDGWFRAEAAEGCVFAATARGFAPDWTIPYQPGDDCTLKLGDDTPVRGRLLDLEGRPVSGAKVRVGAVAAPADGSLQAAYDAFRVNPEEGGGNALPKRIGGGSVGLPAETTTGDDGRFELQGFGRGRVVLLRLEADGLVTADVSVFTVPDFDPKAVTPTAAEKAMWRPKDYQPAVYGPTFTHAAPPCHVITGAVTDVATGKPVAGVKIVGTAGPMYSSNEPSWRNSVEVTTDPAGQFRLSGLPKAKQRFLRAEAGDNPYFDQLVEVKDVEGLAPAPVEIKLHRCVLIEGRITDKVTGKPVKGKAHYLPMTDNWELKARPDTGLYKGGLYTAQPSGSRASTDDDGKFRLRVLHGLGVILARADTLRDPMARYTPARAAETDRQHLRRLDPTQKWYGPKHRADEEAFETGTLFYPLRWENGYAIINPGAEDDVVKCEIRFDPGRTVTGTVVGPDGRPVAGAKAVGVQGTDERRPTTLQTGRFTAYALDPSRPRELFVLHEGRKLAGVLTVCGDEKEPPTVSLRPWAGVTGRVLNADGTPAAGVEIGFQMTDKEPDEFIRHKLYDSRRPAVTDREGRFRLEGLFPGYGVMIHASKPGYRTGISYPPLTPAAGEVKELGDQRLLP